jgi:hypothetical protein
VGAIVSVTEASDVQPVHLLRAALDPFAEAPNVAAARRLRQLFHSLGEASNMSVAGRRA